MVIFDCNSSRGIYRTKGALSEMRDFSRSRKYAKKTSDEFAEERKRKHVEHEVGIFVSENFFYHKKVAIIFLA